MKKKEKNPPRIFFLDLKEWYIVRGG